MAEEKESTSVPLSQVDNGGQDPEDPVKSPPSSPNSSTRKVWIFFMLFNICRLFLFSYYLTVALFAPIHLAGFFGSWDLEASLFPLTVFL